MQISIYLDDVLIQKVDAIAKKGKKSRSSLIQDLLRKEFMGQERESLFDEVFGVLEPAQAEEWLSALQSQRMNSKRFE